MCAFVQTCIWTESRKYEQLGRPGELWPVVEVTPRAFELHKWVRTLSFASSPCYTWSTPVPELSEVVTNRLAVLFLMMIFIKALNGRSEKSYNTFC